MGLTQAELALLIFGVALFFIIVVAVMIYCTFRVRLKRKQEYPIYVIPCETFSTTPSTSSAFISSMTDISEESVQLRKYRRLKEAQNNNNYNNFGENRGKNTNLNCSPNSAFENPTFIEEEMIPVVPYWNNLNIDDNIHNPNRIQTENGGNKLQKPVILEVNSPDSDENEQKLQNGDVQKYRKGSPYLPEDEIAVRLERSSLIRSRSNHDYRKSMASTKSSPDLGAVSPSPSLTVPGSNNHSASSYFIHNPPIPALKLSRDLAEAIAYDKVQENSVSFHGYDSLDISVGRGGDSSGRRSPRSPALNSSMEIICKQRTVV